MRSRTRAVAPATAIRRELQLHGAPRGPWRELTCQGPCGEQLDVLELPARFLDAHTYVCGACLEHARPRFKPPGKDR